MDHDKQRELGAELFPELKESILDESNCFEDIFNKVIEAGLRDRVLELTEMPSEWDFRWAFYIGDRELMRDRVTESQWAYWWARDFGDRELMRERITESKWVRKFQELQNED